MKKIKEFEEVKTGLPKAIDNKKTNLRFLIPFTVVGISLSCFVFIAGTVLNVFLDASGINSSSEPLISFINMISTSLYMGTIALLVGLIQAALLKGRIKSRLFLYLSISSMGGIMSGLIGGALLGFIFSKDNFDTPLLQVLVGNSSAPILRLATTILLLFTKSIIIGVTVGLITGTIVAIAQNVFMRNSKHRFNWARYCVVIWVISCILAWTISLIVGEFIEFAFVADAVAAALILVTHGIGILLFLNNSPEIEFS